MDVRIGVVRYAGLNRSRDYVELPRDYVRKSRGPTVRRKSKVSKRIMRTEYLGYSPSYALLLDCAILLNADSRPSVNRSKNSLRSKSSEEYANG